MLWLAALLVYQTLGIAFAVRPGASQTRRLLAGTMAVLIPLAGPVLAIVVRRMHGTGPAQGDNPWQPAQRKATAADVRRIGDLPPLLERLISTDPAERLAALVALACTADATAVSMLRWAVEHGSPEVVLDAALTLEELDLKREERLQEATRELAEAPSFQRALTCAEAAASGILSGLADSVNVAALADQARACYQLALELEPARADELQERLARLELAAVRPLAALDLVLALGARVGAEARLRLHGLLEDAAFAARRFDLLSPLSRRVSIPSNGFLRTVTE